MPTSRRYLEPSPIQEEPLTTESLANRKRIVKELLSAVSLYDRHHKLQAKKTGKQNDRKNQPPFR